MIKVSVIVPIYNTEKYIERCARSLLEQTLNDIEYIFINDCSTDNSIHILKHVINDYPNRTENIKIIQLDKNHGLCYVRKTGITVATGEYIIFCDSDDWVETNAYQLMYEKAISHNYDIIFCNWKETNGTRILREKQRKTYHNNLKFIKEILKGNEMANIWSALCKQKLYKNDIIYPTHSMIEDAVLTTQLIYYAKSYEFINDSLYFYFINSNSMSRKHGKESCLKRYQEVLENTKKILYFIDKIGYTSSLKNEIISLKYWARLQIGPITNIKEYYQLWTKTYPEIDSQFIINLHIPLRLKLNYILIKTHIYSLLKRNQYEK